MKKEDIKRAIGDIIGQIIVGMVDMVLVVSGIAIASVVLLVSLSLWLMGHTMPAIMILILLLGVTIISRYKTEKNRSRTSQQSERVTYIQNILIAVEVSFIVIFVYGFNVVTCLVLISAIILSNVV